MTREEAIEILKAHHMWTGEPQEIIDVRKENKALEMAIQALSQESCIDAISREAVIELCKNIIDKSDLVDVAYEVRRLPSVTHKSGKWLDINGIYAECSNCNEEIYITGDFKYCPNCGCRMESEE